MDMKKHVHVCVYINMSVFMFGGFPGSGDMGLRFQVDGRHYNH